MLRVGETCITDKAIGVKCIHYPAFPISLPTHQPQTPVGLNVSRMRQSVHWKEQTQPQSPQHMPMEMQGCMQLPGNTGWTSGLRPIVPTGNSCLFCWEGPLRLLAPSGLFFTTLKEHKDGPRLYMSHITNVDVCLNATQRSVHDPLRSWFLNLSIIDILSRIILCCEGLRGWLVHWRMFLNVFDLYPPDATNTSPWVISRDNQKIPSAAIAKCPVKTKLLLCG